MGCGNALKNPYERCAFLLREYELVLRKRKDLFNNKKEGEQKKIDRNVKDYKTKIYENLDKINKNLKTEIEIKKLKELNQLFQVLLTEESQIYNNKNEESGENGIKGKENN